MSANGLHAQATIYYCRSIGIACRCFHECAGLRRCPSAIIMFTAMTFLIQVMSTSRSRLENGYPLLIKQLVDLVPASTDPSQPRSPLRY